MKRGGRRLENETTTVCEDIQAAYIGETTSYKDRPRLHARGSTFATKELCGNT